MFWKGIGVFGEDKGFHSVTRRRSVALSTLGGESMSTKQKDFIFGIILTHLLMTKEEDITSRALIIPFLAIHAKGGESMSPKQKDRTTTNFKNLVFSKSIYQLVSYCVLKREKVVFQKWYIKTLLNTKRRISFRGSFCLVKGKAFETGGENFKSWKCFAKSYSFTFDHLQKNFEKDLQKSLQKQNMWCKRGPKC